MNKIIKDIKEALNTDNKTKAYDTQAKVIRSEGQTLWVHIPGGVDETPVKKTINAKAGDTVQVRVSGGSAWLVGNQSAPPTDDTRAIVAETTAITANENATIAAQAAESAIESANVASSAAARAETSAKTAESQAVSATKSANNALTQLSTVESVVDTLTWIAEHSTFITTTDTTVQSGKTYYIPSNQTLELVSGVTETNGMTFTVDANAGTITVNGTASTVTIFPLSQPNVTAGDTIYLSGCVGGSSTTYGLRYSNGPGSVTIYDGETAKTTAKSSGNLNCNIYVNKDTEMDNVVFNPKVSTENDGYEYVIVENPTGNPSTQGYYELDTSEAVKTYVKSHLSLTNDGLYVLNDASGWKVLIKNTGIEIQNPSGGKVAEYSSTILLGLATETHTILSAEGMKIYSADGTTQIAHLGYGSGTNSSGGTSTTPYYSVGQRKSSTVVGNYSNAEGYDTTASGYVSHAEGYNTTASGHQSHAEGGSTTASGAYAHAEGQGTTASGVGSHAEGSSTVAERLNAHAEGQGTTASGDVSHAEGVNTQAVGDYSHAQNRGTIAYTSSQTALGKFNKVEDEPAVIIGNGTSASSRSNALTVDWSGNVNIASGAKYKINGSNLSASDVGALPISGGTMTSNGQIINGHITNSSTRETTPNLTPTGKRGITALLASSAMTTARPGEGTIIHCEWDNNGGWNSQLFISDNDSGNGKPFVAVRGQRSGTWTAWDRLLAQSDVTDYVIAQSQSTTSYGDGYWRWREWNSGNVEIWYHGSLTLNKADSDYSGVKRYSRWFNLPNSYSLYRCTCIVNGMQEGAWYGCGGTRDSSSTVGAEPIRSFQVMGYRISSAPPSSPTNLNIYICGQKTI